MPADAIFCESCGTRAGDTAPMTKPRKKVSSYVWLVLGILMLAIFIWSIVGESCTVISDAALCYKYAKEVITDELLAPDSATFPAFDPSFVSDCCGREEYDGDIYEIYIVSAYVEASNVFGTHIRHPFEILIGLPTDTANDHYIYEILEVE